MAVLLGKNARIKLNTVTVAKMTSMSVTINGETIDITSFGDTFATFAGGMSSWTASISGFYDKSDASQNTLRAANLANTPNQDIEFWVDATSYYDITVSDATYDGAYITSFTITADNNSVVAFTMEITGSGELAYNAS